MKINQNFAIANVKSGWGLVCFETKEYRGRDKTSGRFSRQTSLKLIPTVFRASTLETACEKLNWLLRRCQDATVTIYLANPREYVQKTILDILPMEEVELVAYIPQGDIADLSTPMGLAFHMARQAFKTEVCQRQDHAYMYAIEEILPYNPSDEDI